MAIEARIWLDLHGDEHQFNAFLDDLATFVASRGFTHPEVCRSVIISKVIDDDADEWALQLLHGEDNWIKVVLPGNDGNPDLKLLAE